MSNNDYPSNDALAQVAVHLALKSDYLKKHQDLGGAFWFFYELLARQRAVKVKAEEDRLRRREAAKERALRIEQWQTTEDGVSTLQRLDQLKSHVAAAARTRIVGKIRQYILDIVGLEGSAPAVDPALAAKVFGAKSKSYPLALAALQALERQLQ